MLEHVAIIFEGRWILEVVSVILKGDKSYYQNTFLTYHPQAEF